MASAPPAFPKAGPLQADPHPSRQPETSPAGGDMAVARPASAPETHAATSLDSIDADFERLLETVHRNRPQDDLDLIRRAWAFCVQQHAGQFRVSGEPYIIHPLAVCQILADMKLDSTAIAAGLLHDAVEDTDVTSAEIARKFNEQVAHIVEGVTKLDKIKFANRADHQAENIRKMLMAMVTDVRVVLIKLADRKHNMETLGVMPAAKQEKIARETLDVYAPLAHRLGMGKLRGQLEDLAFQYTDPFAYATLKEEVDSLRGANEEFLATIVAALERKLADAGVHGRVESRIKRLYSIHQKLVSQKIPVSQVHDLLAVRVICQTVGECYAVLGLLHAQWSPIDGRIKDFIGRPRPNMYQSLHTTLIAPGGHQFEVQIRTEEMHRLAEEGIAAHWKYKAGEPVSAKDDARFAWVRQLMEWQKEMSDPNEFMSTLRIDLYPEQVYTFTPKGKVVELPKDSSPIDFAYAIHTEVGNTCIGAKINGRLVPLRTRLRNGDIVEIMTQAGHTPSRDWLSFTKSGRARNKIRHWLTEHQRERSIEIGKKLIEREAKRWKISLRSIADADYLRAANELGLGSEPELLSGVGFGKYTARAVLNKLQPGSTAPAEDAGAEPPPHPVSDAISNMSDAVKRVFLGKGSDSLQVEGLDDMLVYRARCCNPIRGEEIVGYVTRGKGVAVHGRSCPNVQNLLYESDRRIQVEWGLDPAAQQKPTTYPVKLTIVCEDRPGMLKEFTAIIAADGTNTQAVDSKPAEDGKFTVNFIIDTIDVRHLTRLTLNLRKVPGVLEVHRVQKI